MTTLLSSKSNIIRHLELCKYRPGSFYQYPDRTQKNHTENIFIPFEADTGLSIILSKAFLLADDDKITDSTITTQINHK